MSGIDVRGLSDFTISISLAIFSVEIKGNYDISVNHRVVQTLEDCSEITSDTPDTNVELKFSDLGFSITSSAQAEGLTVNSHLGVSLKNRSETLWDKIVGSRLVFSISISVGSTIQKGFQDSLTQACMCVNVSAEGRITTEVEFYYARAALVAVVAIAPVATLALAGATGAFVSTITAAMASSMIAAIG